MSKVFQLFCETAGNGCYDAEILNSERYREIRQEIIDLQETYEKMNLTDEQRGVIDSLLKMNAALYDEGFTAVYRKGILDAVTLLKELTIL